MAGGTAAAPFIVGVGRSGTTLLRLMLDAHPSLAIPSETHFLPEILGSEGLTPDAFVRILTSSATWPNFGLSEAALRQAVEAVAPFSTVEAVRAFYRLYAERFGKVRWGDKTPPYRAQMIAIQGLLPEARFIHLIRDGRDVALSYRGLWFGPGDSLDAQARFWVEQITGGRRQAEGLPHYLEVRYEALVSEPEATLRLICAYLDLPFDRAMLSHHIRARRRLGEMTQAFGPSGPGAVDIGRFLQIHDLTHEPPTTRRIGRWRTEMSSDERRAYERIAGPLLAQLGYEV